MNFRAQHSRLVPVSAFFKWAARASHLLYNLAFELELPKLDHRLPEALLTAAEADQVLNQPDVIEALGVRVRALACVDHYVTEVSPNCRDGGTL